MGDNSSIEWTDATWNPVTGCTEVSPGCDHCYARVFAERFRGVPEHPYEQGFDLKLWPDRLGLPLRWKKPRRIFVNSMSDLFHKDVPDEFIHRVFNVMCSASTMHHTFQVLTKRPKRMTRYVASHWPSLASYSHIWLGTTIENAAYTWRANYLRQVPAAVRFISAEPLLSALTSLDLAGIHWLIAGGESGPHARPMHQRWPRALRDQCQAAGTAFFFKQHGEWIGMADYDPFVHGPFDGHEERSLWAGRVGDVDDLPTLHYKVGKKAAGRLLDGREWSEYPALEQVAR